MEQVFFFFFFFFFVVFVVVFFFFGGGRSLFCFLFRWKKKRITEIKQEIENSRAYLMCKKDRGIKMSWPCLVIMMTASYFHQYVSFKSVLQWLRVWKSEFDLVFISSTLISKHSLSHPQSATTFTLYLYIGRMWILVLSKRDRAAS